MTENHLRLHGILRLAAIGLLVPCFAIALCSAIVPASKTIDIEDNGIEYSTSVNYKALMKRSLLYPDGGLITPEGSLIRKITNALVFTVETSVSADQPVMIEGTGRCVVRIKAEDLWERDYIVTSSQVLQKTTSSDTIYSRRMVVLLSDLDEYIKKIEEETEITQSSYILTLAPDITGSIVSGKNTFPIEPIPAIKFSYNSGLIGHISEPDAEGQPVAGFPSITTKTFTASHTETTINTLFGAGIPIPVARMIFIPLALLLGCYVGYRPLAGLLAAKSGLSPATRISRKYKNRIVRIMAYPKPTAKAAIEFHSFQEMAHMADQKELPILCYDGGGDTVDYFLIDNGAVYSFKADNHPAAASQSVLPRPAAGKGEQTDA